MKKYFRFLYAPLINRIARFLYGPNRYKHLYQTIQAEKPCSILEIGVWNGNRAVKMIETAKRHQPAEDITYYGFDLFEELDEQMLKDEWSKKPLSYKEVLEKISATGVKVKLYKGNTLKSLPSVISELPAVDFVFIDGGHSNETIANDWFYVSKLMDQSSTVIFDDYWDTTEAGAKQTVDAIDENEYEVEILPTADISKNPKKGKMRFARVTKRL